MRRSTGISPLTLFFFFCSRRQAQTDLIASASSILIAGGGALGIQYATDTADLYNNPEFAHLRPRNCVSPKKITLVHSRDRFLPLYKQEVHDEIMRRMNELGVEVVLGERLELPSVEQERSEGPKTRKVVTKQGKEIEYDLLVRHRLHSLTGSGYGLTSGDNADAVYGSEAEFSASWRLPAGSAR